MFTFNRTNSLHPKNGYLIVFILFFTVSCGSDIKTVYDFEKENDLDEITWTCKTIFSISEKYASSGKKSLKIEMFPAPPTSSANYPGLKLSKIKSNWSQYKHLAFDIFNPQKKPIRLAVRIDDTPMPPYENRFNKGITLATGINNLTLDVTKLTTTGTERSLNLKKVEQVLFFIINPKDKTILYIDNIRLE